MIFTKNTDYGFLSERIKEFSDKYPFIEIFSIGKSFLGRELYALRLGKGNKKLIYVGAHHALEWGTSTLLLKFIEEYAQAYNNNRSIRGFNVKKAYEKCSIYVIPMLNPDGVELVLNGLSENIPIAERVLRINGGSRDFKDWQANIRGVDLNHNYDAGFARSKRMEKENGVFGEGKTRFSGDYPESESETYALCSFTRGVSPDAVFAFHSQGEEIYYDFGGTVPENALYLASVFSKQTGYRLTKPEGISSYGGYKDWFIDKYKKPGFTFEIGRGKNPLPLSEVENAYDILRETLISAAFLV